MVEKSKVKITKPLEVLDDIGCSCCEHESEPQETVSFHALDDIGCDCCEPEPKKDLLEDIGCG